MWISIFHLNKSFLHFFIKCQFLELFLFFFIELINSNCHQWDLFRIWSNLFLSINRCYFYFSLYIFFEFDTLFLRVGFEYLIIWFYIWQWTSEWFKLISVHHIYLASHLSNILKIPRHFIEILVFSKVS